MQTDAWQLYDSITENLIRDVQQGKNMGIWTVTRNLIGVKDYDRNKEDSFSY